MVTKIIWGGGERMGKTFENAEDTFCHLLSVEILSAQEL